VNAREQFLRASLLRARYWADFYFSPQLHARMAMGRKRPMKLARFFCFLFLLSLYYFAMTLFSFFSIFICFQLF
jgi:hypothetical protein